MKKSKLFKTISFSSLALLMGIAGTMAFTPLGASPNNLAKASEMVESTTEQGLITPKKDDQVIYTTESGLEIKWGNAMPKSFSGTLPNQSGYLRGFPYFTTQAGSTTYEWVILGFNIVDFESPVMTWEQVLGSNFNFESNSPAGQAIAREILFHFMVANASQSDTVMKNNTEIPHGSFLVLSNKVLESGAYNTVVNSSGSYKSGSYTGNEDIAKAMEAYYMNGSWGLSQIKDSIDLVSLSTYTNIYNAGWVTQTTSKHIFPLASHASSNFYYGNYLTLEQMKLTSKSVTTYQWLRGNQGGRSNSNYSFATTVLYDSSIDPCVVGSAWVHESHGYRPAFCLKVD